VSDTTLENRSRKAYQDMLDAGLEPLESYPGRTDKPWKCRCLKCGYRYASRVAYVRLGRGCAKCGGSLRVDEDVARQTMLDAGLEPLESYRNAGTPWKSRCLECGHECSPRLSSIKLGQGGCSVCGRERSALARRIDEEVARRAMLNAGLEPLEPYPGSKIPWKFRCQRAHHELSTRLEYVLQGKGCRLCGIRRRGDKRRVNPDAARQSMLNAGLEPLEPYPGYNDKPWKCRCVKYGHECSPCLNSVRRGSGCATCSGNVRIDEDVACREMLDIGLKPLEPYPGADASWKCCCLRCGNEGHPRLAHIRRGQGGCRYCAAYGFSFKEPALIYLLRHDGLAALKIGVTSIVEEMNYDRISHHQRHGWNLIFRWPTRTGRQAWEIEQKVLYWWRQEIGAPPALNAKQMPQNGYTETVSLRFVSIREIRARVEKLRSESS
jgi:hypothetical protein